VPESLKRDPENKYFWRMNRQRLDSESIRDSVLATAGVLREKMYGPAVVPPLSKEELEGMRDVSQWPVTSDPAEYDRRAVYLFVKRSFRNPMMETFDAPDTNASCPRRETSTVAPQSLAMMNGEFINQQAERFAGRLRREAGDAPEMQVERAWRLALGRAPDPSEKLHAVSFLRQSGLPSFCLLVFNLSEFLYVD
jgi:hypothetical protein